MVCSITESQRDNNVFKSIHKTLYSGVLPAILLVCLLAQPAVVFAADAVDQMITVSKSIDLATPPGPLVIWRNEKGGAVADHSVRSRDSWLCLSSTNPRNGACPTSSVWDYYWGSQTPIQLTFTEKRSKNSVVLTLSGTNAFYITAPSNCNELSPSRAMNHAATLYCYGPFYDGVALSVSLPATEYDKIPSGGIWEAQLILHQRQWRPHVDVATWTANITLDVTDRNNGAIYLPAFGTADALVDLNLRTTPLSTAPGGEVSGSTTIDTCLYDGYNSNSPWLQVTLSDTANAPARPADLFSVVKTGSTATDPRNRIDYRVAMHYNGQPLRVENNKPITLTGVNTALIRPVTLPGFRVPVICTPTPLDLTVLPFAKASKTAGRYSGTLRVNLAADALAP